jgi:DNA-binding NarL/FixJ family response regulator
VSRPLRVLVVDDHPVVRDGLRALLEPEADLELVGEAGSAQDAVRAAGRLAPDVVVMDLRMPGVDGLQATRTIVAARPRTGVVAFSLDDDEGAVLAALRAGARGFATKDADPDAVVQAIRAAALGDTVLTAAVGERLLARLTGAPAPAARAFPDLTGRERDVLERLAAGASTGEIAGALELSAKTVRNHVASVCAKLGVVDRTQAALRAREAGLGRPAAL